MRKELLKIAEDLDKRQISESRARTLLLGLLGVSTRAFKIGDSVKWRGMNLIVVEVGINELLIATSENANDENYNDWWVNSVYVC